MGWLTPFVQRTYSKLPGVSVEELRLRESDLNTKRMLDLMQVGGGSMPLYSKTLIDRFPILSVVLIHPAANT